MRYIQTITSIINVDEQNQVTIISTDSTITPLDIEIVDFTFQLTQSQKDYNYVSLGKYANIQLSKNTPIKVSHGSTLVNCRTHKTQLNRFDRMKPILESYNVGDFITIRYNSNTNEIIFL